VSVTQRRNTAHRPLSAVKARKVAHLTSAHPPGDTRITYRECATLAAAGYEVVLIAAGPIAQPLPPGVRLHTVPKPRNRFERMTRTVLHVLRAALEEKADVYHFHDPELAGVGLVLRALGARVVFDVHEDIPKDIIDKTWIAPAFRKPLAYVSAAVLRFLERRFSAIVAATPSIASGFISDRTVVVCNYPRLDEFAQIAPQTGSERDPAAIYLGSITKQRCIEEMVRAMASPSIGRARMLLAGTFEDEELEQSVRQIPGWERVQYEGQCSRAEVARLLSKASVGLLLFHAAANHEDCMPNKLFEYMAAGLPVIIADTMNCKSIIVDNDCGLVVDPRDVDAIAAAISYLVENPAIAAAMGERGKRLTLEQYQWSSEARKLTSLYARIA
jgi:glycosyltransferase involved in cell wall biosynthesis